MKITDIRNERKREIVRQRNRDGGDKKKCMFSQKKRERSEREESGERVI